MNSRPLNKSTQYTRVKRVNKNECSLRPLKILSWNIHDASAIDGKKIEDGTFLNIINQAEIFCLQETKEDIKVPNYRCYNSLRADSRSGGVCLGIRNELVSLLKPIETTKYCSDFQAFKLAKEFLGTQQDLMIVNVYDSPSTSSYKIKKSTEGDSDPTLSKLNEFCASLPQDSIFFITGDMNARTGGQATLSNYNEVVIQQLIEGDFTRNAHTPKRASKDTVLNDRGKQLIDFGCEWNLKILNGATVGDLLGDWTCYRYNGNSVVDYMMVSHCLQESISFMKILELNEHSDHRPLLCSIRMSAKHHLHSQSLADDQFSDKPLGYKWVANQHESKRKFLAAQNEITFIEQISSVATSSCSNSEDVYNLNSKLIEVYKSIANSSLQKKKRPNCSRRQNKKVWFDDECRQLKKALNKAARRYSSNPEDEQHRVFFYEAKRHYRSVIRCKKRIYYCELNSSIEENNRINWDGVKKLKTAKKDPEQLDLHDLSNFYEFFKRLYGETSSKHDESNQTSDVRNCLQNTHLLSECQSSLNSVITIEELNSALKKLRKGKAAGEDCITNEFLVYSNTQLRLAILNLFNQCLDNGTYPWNSSVVTPLHKKGDRYNPDNYRAIAVSSAVGKLFSNVLLNRLVDFRSSCCPDPKNQLGFCKEAQTMDHIFTLNTCISKYINQGNRLYSCFIDFRKAFDTVNREALLYKLSQLGINGKYFDCIKHMYSHSKAKIKLLNKLSKSMDVKVGTEQGHPMSPELFKVFLLDLSHELNSSALDVEVPELNGTEISHLLWADDLVLLALDNRSLQTLIDTVHNFCDRWGLQVNISKTAVLVFNKSGRQLKESTGFKYGEINVPSASTYCYLGITVTLSGSLSKTTEELRKKGLRAYFALKSLIDINELSSSSIIKLFDALILPVVSYGGPVWTFNTMFIKEIISNRCETQPTECLKRIATDPIERLHIKFLKWNLGLHKKASNIFCWGDTGRCPLVQKISKQAVDFFERLSTLSYSKTDCLARHAFDEQKKLKLSWYSNMSALISLSQSTLVDNPNNRMATGSTIRETLQNKFQSTWRSAALNSTKLQFYMKVKGDFSFEEYLNIKNRDVRRSLAQLRSSSHRLNIETARYVESNTKVKSGKHNNKVYSNKEWNRSCKLCCGNEVELLQQLPFAEKPIIEDEQHILASCPAYHHLRLQLDDHIKSTIVAWDERLPSLFEEPSMAPFGLYVHKIFQLRFPKKKKGPKKPERPSNQPPNTQLNDNR